MPLASILAAIQNALEIVPSLSGYHIYPYKRIALRPTEAPVVYGSPNVALITISREATIERPLSQCEVLREHRVVLDAFRHCGEGGTTEPAFQEQLDDLLLALWSRSATLGGVDGSADVASVEIVDHRLLGALPVHHALCVLRVQEIVALPPEAVGIVGEPFASALAEWYAAQLAAVFGIGQRFPFARILLTPGDAGTELFLASDGPLAYWHISRESTAARIGVGGRLTADHRLAFWSFSSIDQAGATEAAFQEQLEQVATILRQPIAFDYGEIESHDVSIDRVEHRTMAGAISVHAARCTVQIRVTDNL